MAIGVFCLSGDASHNISCIISDKVFKSNNLVKILRIFSDTITQTEYLDTITYIQRFTVVLSCVTGKHLACRPCSS